MLVEMPHWAESLFKPFRYKVLFGGRGSGKSYAVADYLLIEALRRPCRILCAREFQNSLADSVLHLLEQRIDALGIRGDYDVQRETIIGSNGSQFIFKGVRNNVQSIKSMSGLTHLWLEEAQTVTKSSWDVLIPTIREPGSEIVVTFNPLNKTDPTYLMFVESSPGDDAYIAKVNWRDNPHWPDELEKERVRLLRNDPVLYAHVYEGECLERTDSQVFAGKFRVDDFEPQSDWDGPYNGLDFGFAQDPTAAVKCWIYDDRLYIEYEAGRIGLELDDTAAYVNERVPGFAEHAVRADCARPESISYLKRPDPNKQRPHMPRIEPVKKWAGSVEDGISFIKSFREVVIHTRCTEMQKEARLYSFKTDKRTGDILPLIEDANNHYWDAVRYALGGLIKGKQAPMGIRLGVAN